MSTHKKQPVAIALLIRRWPTLIGLCVAMSTGLVPAQDSNDPAFSANATLEEMEAEYREMICVRAADPSHELYPTAISLVARYRYTDERFNAVVYRALRDASDPEHADIRKAEAALRLLPWCTLDNPVKMKLIFECYLKCHDAPRTNRSVVQSLTKHLKLDPAALGQLLEKRMSEGDYPIELLSLVKYTEDARKDLLPMVTEAAKSEDPKLAMVAMSLAGELISDLKKSDRLSKKESDRKQSPDKKEAPDELDAKLALYAKRIVQRYDINNDDSLSKSETEKMLMSPQDADVDGDGLVTIPEYANWIRLRQRK